MTRKIPFENGKFYHVYNRGVDKRITFSDKQDYLRFKQTLLEFNTKKPVGGVYSLSFNKKRENFIENQEKLVEIISYNLLPNHFHLILKQLEDRGISEFMQKITGGYSKYFNEKNKRSGALFQGKFKSVEVTTNEYLKHLLVYVNFNHTIHNITDQNLIYSSLLEFSNKLPETTIKLSNYKEIENFVGTFDEFIKSSSYSLEYSKELKEKKRKGKDIWFEE